MKNKEALKGLRTIETELETIETEIKQSEIHEALAMIESRHNFNLGLTIGLIFAVVAGFFSIIAHEIFIQETSYLVKLMLVLFSFIVLILCLIIGLMENKMNKVLRNKILHYLKKRKN